MSMSMFLSIGGLGTIIISKILNCFKPLQRIQGEETKGRESEQKKAKPTIKKQRGRKGLDAIFSKGKQGIVKVDPYRKTLRFGKKRGDAVADGLSQAFSLFARKTIQNNLSETTNSMFKSHVRLRGLKTIENAERNVRTKSIVRNTPNISDSIRVNHNLRLNFLFEVFATLTY